MIESSEKRPPIWIMKITPGGSGNTKKYFENLFIKEDGKKLIGYTKEEGKIEGFSDRWKRIKIGDLIVILEGFNRVFSVVEITSNAFDDKNGAEDSDWFYHRRKAKLIKYFNPCYHTKKSTNRDTIIEYSGYGAISIIDEVWELIKEEYWSKKKNEYMEDKINLLKYKNQIILQGPPGTGKTYLAKKMASEMTTSTVKLSTLDYIERYIKDFKQNDITKRALAATQALLDEFIETFPASDLNQLSLDTYCRGKGSQNSFCYWIENALITAGRFSPGQGGNYVYGIYYSPEANEYKTDKFDDTPDKAMKFVADMIHNMVNNKDASRAVQYFRKSYILKILNSYYNHDYFPIYSHKHLEIIASKLFNLNIKGKDDIEINSMINQKFKELKEKHNSEITNYQLMWHLYEKFDIKDGLKEIDENTEIKELGEYKLIQFHPAYTYEDFVRGITAKTNTNNQIEYKVENKVLSSFADKALKDSKSNYVLIIDEINRANLPAVLGELIYALEYRYDKDKPKETTVESMYSIITGIEENIDNTLALPQNLYIIGTMNTADRSVGHIDYAIRRRFAFVDMLPSFEPVHQFALPLFREVSEFFIENIDEYEKNPDTELKKSKYLASDFRPEDVWIGHSYFITKKEELPEAYKELKDKLEFEIIPILKEYIKDGVLNESSEINKKIKDLFKFISPTT